MKHQNIELVINFSGGKDSSAMLAYLCEHYPQVKKRIIMADTGWEHKDAVEWCKKIVALMGLQLDVCRNENKTFLSMIRKRRKFPSATTRQCTSDLKRGPIQTWIRRNIKSTTIINCMGMRAQESRSRGKLNPLKRNKALTNSKRTVWDWLPIHHWNEMEVLDYLEKRNIPLHPIYRHLRRFSCRICIFMNDHDLSEVKQYDPEAYRIIADLEKEINFSMRPGKYLS
ncbi:Phosphoadenosine phosphosulfate reductase family protein [Chitinophaga sp. YR573]|uniref:phosphoadenosine phosphosulfate reductase family protein n=1 Tax=Chitinophaga sp. YR573 TaxID=1881040 RepID=UPI0008CDA734|nr:phosphoadenosine phosphosulfate reductase family protein [Chitinophaga sp. YR573]SEW21684.1 Phosphoadenosine phosphosulfate reductase family protein [Chitinophaga sp. YR573]